MDKKLLKKLVRVGHSRIPVYRNDREHIVGIERMLSTNRCFMILFSGVILVKTLIMRHPDEEIPVDQLEIARLPTVSSALPLYSMLSTFQTGKSHMAMVLDEADSLTPIGIVTLEDVIEELIQGQIEDEYDILRASNQPLVNTDRLIL